MKLWSKASGGTETPGHCRCQGCGVLPQRSTGVLEWAAVRAAGGQGWRDTVTQALWSPADYMTSPSSLQGSCRQDLAFARLDFTLVLI